MIISEHDFQQLLKSKEGILKQWKGKENYCIQYRSQMNHI